MILCGVKSLNVTFSWVLSFIILVRALAVILWFIFFIMIFLCFFKGWGIEQVVLDILCLYVVPSFLYIWDFQNLGPLFSTVETLVDSVSEKNIPDFTQRICTIVLNNYTIACCKDFWGIFSCWNFQRWLLQDLRQMIHQLWNGLLLSFPVAELA